MKTLYLQAEVLTPLVIAGAAPRSSDVLAEGLRPPSLRGAMRWWFRAMMGSIVGAHDNYKTLRSLEGRVFGSTNQSSSIRLRTCLDKGAKDTAYLCMNDQRAKKFGAPKDYNKIQKPGIAPNGQVIIYLESQSHTEFALALCSLWLTAMLGGVGNRSRRGFGSLALSPKGSSTVRVTQHLNLDFSYPDKPLKDIAEFLESNLKQIYSFFKHYAPAVSPVAPKFFVLSKTQAKLWLIEPRDRFWTSWQEAMNELRDNFYRFYKTSFNLSAIGSANPRFASPLIIQIKRVALTRYFGVLLAFDHSWYNQQWWSSWKQLEKFLNKLLPAYEYQEVMLP